MTLPINGLTKLIGHDDPAGQGPRSSLRKSQIRGLAVREWSVPVFVDGVLIEFTAPRYAVMAVSLSNLQVRIADFATRAEADTYVTNDPLGLTS